MENKLTFGSVCSGIEASQLAFSPYGYEQLWSSEIAEFPSKVLHHHYPNIPNLGDMTELPDLILNGKVQAPDIFCGGTPCQAFSLAGWKNGLADKRGQLTITFIEIANAIDEIREKVTPIAKKYDIKEVYLFGSYARGEADENSDVDLVIVSDIEIDLFLLINSLFISVTKMS